MGSGSTATVRESRAGPVWLVLTVIGSGALITALDQTVVVTALPALMLDLKVPITELDRVSWVVTAYLLGYTVAMPVVGRLADVYGCARVYRVSLVVFMAGTTLVALAGSLEWVIGARVVQAVGGGATVPVGMAIAVGLLPPERRGLALGIVGGAAEAGRDAGAGLRRGHRGMAGLAVDFLAQRAAGRAAAAGLAVAAQPTQPAGAGGLPGRCGANRPAVDPVPGGLPAGLVYAVVAAALRHWRVRTAAGGVVCLAAATLRRPAAAARLVPFRGSRHRQLYPIPGGDCADYRPGHRPANGQHRHGPRSLDRRPVAAAPDRGHSGRGDTGGVGAGRIGRANRHRRRSAAGSGGPVPGGKLAVGRGRAGTDSCTWLSPGWGSGW